MDELCFFVYLSAIILITCKKKNCQENGASGNNDDSVLSYTYYKYMWHTRTYRCVAGDVNRNNCLWGDRIVFVSFHSEKLVAGKLAFYYYYFTRVYSRNLDTIVFGSYTHAYNARFFLLLLFKEYYCHGSVIIFFFTSPVPFVSRSSLGPVIVTRYHSHTYTPNVIIIIIIGIHDAYDVPLGTCDANRRSQDQQPVNEPYIKRPGINYLYENYIATAAVILWPGKKTMRTPCTSVTSCANRIINNNSL